VEAKSVLHMHLMPIYVHVHFDISKKARVRISEQKRGLSAVSTSLRVDTIPIK